MKKTGIYSILLIICLLLSGTVIQTDSVSDATSDALKSKEDQDASPKTSDFNQLYDLGGGNTMTIDALDSGTTDLTMNNGTANNNVNSIFTEGTDASNNGSADTTINSTINIKTVGDNKTLLTDSENNFNVSVDNDFNPHGVEIEAENMIDGINNPVSTKAQASSEGDQIDNFDWHVDSFFDVYYYIGNPSPGDERLEISNAGQDLIINKQNDLGFLQLVIGPDSDNYLFNNSNGNVYWWNYTASVPDWELIGTEGDCDFVSPSGASSVFSRNSTFIITDGASYEVILTYITATGFNIIVYSYVSSFTLVWNLLSYSIIIYWGLWIYTFYLLIANELLYVIVYNDYDWKIEYYITYIIIVWWEIVIEIWFLDIYIYWLVYFIWEWWIITIEWWFIFIEYWIFVDYYVSIEYRYTSYHWYYYYYVPTLYIPNILHINIINQVFTNTTFLIVIEVVDYLGAPIDAANIAGSWNSIALTAQNITINGDGTYDINITAKLVAKGDPGLPLSLTASMIGYADGILNTEIAVDPYTVNSVKDSGDDVVVDDDDDDKANDDDDDDAAGGDFAIPAPGFIMVGTISAIAMIFIAVYLSKRKQFFER